MLPFVIVLFVILIFLTALLFFRAAAYGWQIEPVEPADPIDVDKFSVADHLGRAVRIQTISWEDPNCFDRKAFLALHDELERMYPRVHRVLQRETVNQYSLLYTWTGQDLSLKPVLLMAHMDVVPVEAGSEKDWEHPPFSGEMADGFVWGRGTMDIKNQVVGILEAVDWLLQNGFKPERTVYLAFSHDEELDGPQGGAQIAKLLAERGVELEAVLDEGGSVVTGAVPGVLTPVALLGVTEKGYLTLEMCVDADGGHSSMPPEHTAIGRLSQAVRRVEENPMPARLHYINLMFGDLASELPLGMRLLFANQWLFGKLIQWKFGSSPTTNAMIRTTTAVTMISGGVKDNILPRQARASVNFRLLPCDSIQSVIEHVRKVVNDPGVRVNVNGKATGPGSEPAPEEGQFASASSWEAAPVSDPSGAAYTALARTIRRVFKDAVVAPFMVVGATDARHYAGVCDQVFRFSPIQIDADDMHRVHGVNERLSVENCGQMVHFYVEWIREIAG